MSKVPLLDTKGSRIGEYEVPDEVLVTRGAKAVVYEVVTAYLANQRAGTASTKTRGEVSGSGAKPWRQKGTGRARVGSIRSPIWRHGGIVFGPKPRDYSVKVPAKKKLLALRRVLGDKVVSGQLMVIEKFAIAEPRTRLAAALLRSLKADKGCLFVDAQVSPALKLSVRNIPNVEALPADSVSVYDLMRYPMVVFSREGWTRMQERIQKAMEAWA